MNRTKTTVKQSLLTLLQQPALIRYYLILLIVLPMFLGVITWFTPDAYAIALQTEPTGPVSAANAHCSDALPILEWLGDGPGNFVLNEGFDTFVVKRHPFSFFLENGQVNTSGQTIYRAKANERVWVCQGNCQLPAVYHDAFVLGSLQSGTIVNLVVIDDDGLQQNNDQRRNWWAMNNPLDPYLVVKEQAMVEYLSLEIPAAGDWYYYADDSIGIVASCIEPVPTPTSTVTPEPTATPTATETTVPSSTPTASSTPVDTATSTPTPTATVTNTPVTATATPTSTATEVSTPTGNGTPPVQVTMTITPTITIKEPPTAIQLLYLEAGNQNNAIVLQWETALEIDFAGFQLWRSSNGYRADAQLVSPSLIASRGTASSGAAYTFVDANVNRGVHYTYWLQQVAPNGTSEDVRMTTAELLYNLYLPLIDHSE